MGAAAAEGGANGRFGRRAAQGRMPIDARCPKSAMSQEGARMAEKRHLGKLFYVAIAILLICVIVPSCVFIFVFTQEIEASSSQIESVIESVFASGVEQYSDVDPDEEHDSELAELLNDDGLIDEAAKQLAGQGAVDEQDEAELMARLEDLQDILYSYMGCPHSAGLLFLETGDSICVGEDDVSTFSQEDLDAICALELSTSEELTFLHTDGTMRTTMVHAIADGVLLLTTRSEDDYLEDATDILLSIDGVQEIAQYDSLGTLRLVYGDGNLAGAFSYGDFEVLDEMATVEFEADGQSYLCFYIASSESSMVLAMFMENTFAAARKEALGLLVLVIVVAVAACAAFAALFRRQVYAPVQQLASRVNPDADAGFDELGDIERGVARLEQENERQSAMVRDAALLHLLHGHDSLAVESDARGFPFDEEGSCVVVGMRVESLADPAQADKAPQDGSAALTEQAAAILRAELAAAGFKEAVETNDGLLEIFVVRTDAEGGAPAGESGATTLPTGETTRAVAAAGEKAREGFSAAGGKEASLSFFISEIVGCGSGLKDGYDQVSALAEHCIAMERYGTVLRHEDFEGGPQRSRGLDAQTMRKFLEAVQDLSIERTAARFDEIVEEMGIANASGAAGAGGAGGGETGGENASRTVVRKDDPTLTALRSLMHVGLSSCPAAGSAGFDWEARLDEALDKATSVEDMREALLSTMRAIKAAGERESADKNRFEQVERFVQDNIADANLSGQMVAKHFGMAQSNLTRMFKKFTGDGFLAYVHALRVERAKGILVETDLPLDEVASRVGFGNALTMSRAFKKSLGMTPYAYREAHRQKADESQQDEPGEDGTQAEEALPSGNQLCGDQPSDAQSGDAQAEGNEGRG